MRIAIRLFIFILLCASTFAVETPARAQSWPTHPARVVVPWAPGGATDILARLLANKFSQEFGQPFVVDNRPGGSGNVGALMVARSEPDGYTLLVTNPGAFATNQYLYKQMQYKPSDFAGVMLIAEFPNALMVYKDLPVKSTAELVDYAKKNPTILNGGSSGVGTMGHLALEMFKSMTGTQIQNVFYKGASLSKLDLATGRIHVVIDNIPGYLSELNSGSVRMIAVGTKTRAPSFPNVPTLDESGLKGYQSSVWYALAVPKGVPVNIVRRLNATAATALRSPEFQERLKQLYGSAMGGSPEDADRFFAEESKRWKAIIEAAGVTPE